MRWRGCAPTRTPAVTLVTLSGRGDKDIHTVATASGHEEFLA